MPLTVALIAGGGFQGQGIIEAIHAVPGTRVVVVDSTSDAPGELHADCYVIAPPLDVAIFEDFLLDIIRTEGIDLVVPATQRELRVLAASASRLLAAGARTAVCPPGLLDVLLDKQVLYDALDQADIPVQPQIELTMTATLPLFGRPRSGWGGIGAIAFKSLADLDRVDVESLSRTYVWVPLLESFAEFSADFCIDFQKRMSPLTLRRRLRTSGGFAVVSQSDDDVPLMLLLDRLALWLAERGGCGLFNVQVLRTKDGLLYVSDINPRHGTSGGHALAEGNNLLAFLLGDRSSMPRQPVRTIRSLTQQSIPLFEHASIGGVAFDLDDTLIDHKRWIFDRMQLAATRLASDIDTSALLLHTYMALEQGEHARLIDVIAERLGIETLHGDLLRAYREAVPAHAPVYPEVFDVFGALRAQGLKLALLTDNPPASQRAKLAACGALAEAFDLVVFSREHGAEKPAKAGFDAVADGLGVPAHRLLMVGDNPARDAIGAWRAGWLSCLLVDRQGGRYRIHRDLMARVAPEATSRTWTAPDLRSLPMALRLACADKEK